MLSSLLFLRIIVGLFISLAFAFAVILAVGVFSDSWMTTIPIEEPAQASQHICEETLANIRLAVKSIYPLNISTLNIGRFLSSSLGTTTLLPSATDSNVSVWFASYDLYHKYGGDLYLATKDGIALAKTGPHSLMLDNGMVSIIVMNSNKKSASRQRVDFSCEPKEELLRRQNVVINGKEYMVYCEPLYIAGVPSVSVLVYPHKGLLGAVHRHSKIAMVLLIILIMSLFGVFSSFMFLSAKSTKREMFLRALLIKQIEATQQAERKSMNKSLAFASASHDVRSSLAALDGIINLCSAEVDPKSEIYMNLEHMKTSTADLIGLLNSVLDTSKIEAGKMQLTKQEFYLAEVLEESVNLYYPVANDKGIDLVLDPCDGSVVRHALVKGDRGKLKQVLNNLLHNAIKFTSDGHIAVRAWVKKPSPETTIFTSDSTGIWKCLPQFLYKNNEHDSALSPLKATRQHQNFVEFLIEVDDTGVGIPKEKQKTVFEDFVQVKETVLGHGGTGLGLGIVQSLVRLMGGDIGIVDKRFNEKGTCFRFNIFLTTTETASANSSVDRIPMELNQILEVKTRNTGSVPEGSHVVLYIQGGERRRAVKKFFQSVGAKVSTVDSCELVFPTLEKIKHKWHLGHRSYSGKSDLGSFSDSLSTPSSLGMRDMCINVKDGKDNPSPLHRRTNSRSTTGFVLVIVDFSTAHFSDEQFLELHSILENFRKDVSDVRCKVVWLYTPKTDAKARRLDERKLAKCELVVSKPLHGSRLYQLLKLLPEFGGAPTIPGYRYYFTDKTAKTSNGPHPSIVRAHVKADSGSSKSNHRSENENVSDRGDTPRGDKILAGKKVLVAEDVMILRKVVIKILEKHGATVECCQNGEEAVNKVRNALLTSRKRSESLPYDVIFMDCEMPIMDGYEATRQIRLEEKLYNVQFPIVALTAHGETEEETKILQAGMDTIITKPLNGDNLLKAIRAINRIYKET